MLRFLDRSYSFKKKSRKNPLFSRGFPTTIGTYVSGAVMGTFMALYVYILFFDTLKNTKIASPKNMNYCIGVITLVVAIATLINLLR